MRFSLGWRRVRWPLAKISRDRHTTKTHRLISFLYQSFTQVERWLLMVFLIATVIASAQLIHQRRAETSLVPVTGGIYREGILTNSARDLDMIDDALTKIGLVKLGTSGSLEPALATEWQVSDDAQTTRVRIHNGVTAEQVVDILKQQTDSGYWKEAEFSIPESQIIEFHLSQPWAGFVNEFVTPIFPYGPYKKGSVNQADIIAYTSRADGIMKPIIPTIEIHLYSDSKTLERALRKNALDGIFSTDETEINLPSGWQSKTPSLFREHILFFNLRRDALTVSVRGHLTRNEPLDAPLELHLAVPEETLMATMAADLASRWQTLGAHIVVEEYPLLTLTKTILPERDYDLLLLGVDYGPDGDFYPYFHSSQIAAPGQNLAGYRNKEVDRLLDESRRLSNATERHARYEAARQILARDNVFISFGSPTVNFARSPKVKGAIPEHLITATNRWTDIASWYMKERRVHTNKNNSN